MTDNTRRADESTGGEHADGDPLSLQAYLDRQLREFANGPTVAEIFARAEARRSGGVPRELIAAAIREDREERAG